MTAPIAQLSITNRHRLKDMTWQQSLVVPPGRMMLCKGRKIIGYADLAELVHANMIVLKADTICLSSADFNDVKAWVG